MTFVIINQMKSPAAGEGGVPDNKVAVIQFQSL